MTKLGDWDFAKFYKRIQLVFDIIWFYINSFIIDISLMFGKKCKSIEAELNSGSENKSEIAFIGNIDPKSIVKGEAYFVEQMNSLLNNPALILSYFYNDNRVNVGNIYNAAQLNDTVIRMGDKNLGITVFDIDELKRASNASTYILKRKKNLIKSGADFCIAYVKKSNDTENRVKYKKLVGKIGFDYVIGADNVILRKKSMRTLTFGETRIAYGLGNITNSRTKKDTMKSGVAIKVSLIKVQGKVRVAREGYMPLILKLNNRRLVEFEELTKAMMLTDQVYEKHYLEIQRIMSGFRNLRELILLKELFEVLNLDIPEKYSYLYEFGVNEICTRISEAAPGTVYFYRQKYTYNKRLEKDPTFGFHRNMYVRKAIARRCLFIFSHKKLP